MGLNSVHDLIVTGTSPTRCATRISRPSASAMATATRRGTALGSISFYVLDGQASSTSPLIGTCTLRSKRALISHFNGMFLFRDDEKAPNQELPVFAIQMKALKSGHLTLDFSQKPHAMMKLDFRGATPAWMIDEWPHQNSF